MNVSTLLKVAILCFVLLIACTSKNKEHISASAQNIVLILVDDLGWADLSYNGSTFYETPHIDALSKASINFTDAYAAGSVCSPSRAAILTGKHPVRVDITDWLQGQNPQNKKYLGTQDLEQLPLEEITLAELLKTNNYKTFFSGKWHLGGEGYHPEEQGFDINIGGHDKGSPPGGYYSPYKNPKLSDGPEGEYLTDRLTDESIDFLDRVGDDPFFLMLSYYTVHTPIQANKKYIEKFQNKLSTLGHSEIRLKDEGNGRTVLNQVNAAYASMVYAMDENVGKLIDGLKKKGLYDNTTLIFTSDNGGLSTLEKNRKNPAPTSVLPLRGGKGWLYEGGIRVPLLIKPAKYYGQSKEINTPVVGHDIYPTVAKIAGADLPSGVTLDGVDLSPLLRGEDRIDRAEIWWHYPHYHGSGWTPGAAMRQGDWKFIEFHETEEVQLFNLSNDLAESNDLAKEYPDKVASLQQRLKELQTEMNAKFISPNPNYQGPK